MSQENIYNDNMGSVTIKQYAVQDLLKGGKSNVRRGGVAKYLGTLDRNNLPTPAEMERYALKSIKDEFETVCCMMPKNEMWKKPDELSPSDIADIILFTENVRCVACAGIHADEKYDILAVYQTGGINEGIYVNSETRIRQLAQDYNYGITTPQTEELIRTLKTRAPRIARCEDRDLIAVDNGIFNYKTKELMAFDPNIVFMAKSYVNYNHAAQNVFITHPDDGSVWDIESWLSELSDNKEVVALLWEILGAIIRPFVSWNKAAWLFSTTGNNGKGSLCKLMRNLCGPNSYASIPIADFGKDFLLEHLTHATAVIVDENDVGLFIDKAANLKTVVTGDVMQINCKFKMPILFQFHGMMVQCLNELPQAKDKSDSFYRRQLFIPFDKCFTGAERKYIKDDYLGRPDVLEYVMHKVLHSDYYELSNPQVCQQALTEYKELNDTVREYWLYHKKDWSWDFLPFTFLYCGYKGWHAAHNPSGKPVAYKTFIKDLLNTLKGDDMFICKDKSNPVRPGKMMDTPEYLIHQYAEHMKEWRNPTYKGDDWKKICKPALKVSYTGIHRIQTSGNYDD